MSNICIFLNSFEIILRKGHSFRVLANNVITHPHKKIEGIWCYSSGQELAKKTSWKVWENIRIYNKMTDQKSNGFKKNPITFLIYVKKFFCIFWIPWFIILLRQFCFKNKCEHFSTFSKYSIFSYFCDTFWDNFRPVLELKASSPSKSCYIKNPSILVHSEIDIKPKHIKVKKNTHAITIKAYSRF